MYGMMVEAEAVAPLQRRTGNGGTMAVANFGAAHATAAAAGAAHAAAAAGAAQATAAATGATAATVRLATGPPGGRRRFAGPVNAKAEKSIRGDRTSTSVGRLGVVSRGSSQSGARTTLPTRNTESRAHAPH